LAKVRRRIERRQSYLTASRMQRRRSWLESKLGKRQDFDRKEEESAKTAAPISTSAAPEPGYVVEP
jgi:hypothetical protein